MASLGQELKRERELRDISLNDIAHATKINIQFLKALEEDRPDLLPGKFFIKGILRAYSKYIGLDEDYVLNTYYQDALFQESEDQKEEKKEGHIRKTNFWRRQSLTIALLLLFLVAACSIYFFLWRPSKTRPPASSPAVPAPLQPEKVPVIAPPIEEPVLQNEEKTLSLEISFQAETWIQVYADGELKIDGLKYSGERVIVTALQEFLLNMGNAGGISYTINGKPGKPLGSSGTVVKNIRISLDNYSQFLLPAEQSLNKEISIP
ncbi:MAG: RodZ domain-containing protein [Candidatus Aminicenantales bacterium]